MEIFTVLGERDGTQADPAWLAGYEEGLRHYRNRRFAEAVAHFETALVSIPGDWLCESYLAKSRDFAANPPSEDWSPVDVMTSK